MAEMSNWIELICSQKLEKNQISKLIDSIDDFKFDSVQILNYVIKNDNDNMLDEDNIFLTENCKLMIEYKSSLEGDLSRLLDTYRVYKTIKVHFSKQLQNMEEKQTKLYKESAELQVELKDFQTKFRKTEKQQMNSIKETTKDLEEIKNIRGSIYTDFVAILGVFSAFITFLFGGIEIFRAIFDKDVNLDQMNITKTLFIAIIFMAILITLLYVLLFWVSQISGKQLNGTLIETSRCLAGIKNHSFYLTVMAILFIICLILYFKLIGIINL